MPTFEELKQLGLIKSFNSRTTVDQTAQNKLQEDNKEGESILDEVQFLSENYKTNFTHNTELLTSSSSNMKNYTLEEFYNIPIGSRSISINNQSNGKNTLSLTNVDAIKESGYETYLSTIVRPSIEYEKKSETLFYNLEIGLNNRDSVLTFLNSFFTTSASAVTFEKTLEKTMKFINIPYASELIAKRLSGDLKYKEDSNSKDEQNLYSLVEEIKKGLPDVPRFAGLVRALTKTGEGVINDSQQASRSGRVLTELLFLINSKRLFDAFFIKDRIHFEAIGGSGDKEFIKRIQKCKNKPDEAGCILEEAERYAGELAERVLDENLRIRTNKLKAKEGSITDLAIGLKFQSGGGSKESSGVHAADLKMVFDEEDNYIDVKSGMAKNPKTGLYQARYTAATDTVTSIEKIYQKSLLDDSALTLFLQNIEIIVNYMFYKVLKATDRVSDADEIYKELNSNGLIVQLVTYAFITSTEFMKYVRSIDSGNIKQPVFVLTVQGFFWYSDFLQFIGDALFNSSGGNKVRFSLSYAFADPNKERGEEQKKIKMKQQQQMISGMANFLKNITTKNEVDDFLEFSNRFIKQDQIYYKIDISNVFNRVNKNLAKHKK